MITRTARRLRPRRPTPTDAAGHANDDADRGAALLLVVMLAVIVGMLGLLITASVVRQVRPTLFAEKNTRTVFAAESGLQAALSQLRTVSTTTTKGTTTGDLTRLPCSASGVVDNAGDALTYRVDISYFTTDPSGKDPATVDPTASGAGQIACSPTTGLSTVPLFAYLEATGAAAGVMGFATTAGDRALVSTYTFDIDTSNIPGGLFWTATQAYCLQATTATAGSTVAYVASASCATGTPLQTWVYDNDYKIKLGSTVGTTAPLCLSRPASETADVTLAVCATSPVTTHARQLYSYEGGGKFRTQNDAGTDYGTTCLWAGSTTVSSTSTLKAGAGGCNSNNQDWGSFSPQPQVGAGAASAATQQIVSYRQFGRCADVTSGDINASYMIVYPCKQDPSGSGVPAGTGKLSWNHRWYYTTPTSGSSSTSTISVLQNGTTRYCLTAPAAGTSPAYVVFDPCTGAADQAFTRTEDTGRYATSYTFLSSTGLCLALGPEQSPAGIPWATMVMATCTGGLDQKWNAEPDTAGAALTNTREILGG